MREKIVQRLQLNQQAAAARAEAVFQEALEAHAQGEETVVAQAEEFLTLREKDNIRKKATLHRGWHAEVFDKIQLQIDNEVSRRARRKEIGARWLKAQDEYLVADGRKEQGVLRDVIIESEYDPLICMAARVTYNSKGLKDPTKVR